MEEKVLDGREKKYVLYTVVGEERGRGGWGVWLARALVGSLVLMALAMVPYVSVTLAQSNDHPLVVYQPLPVPAHHHEHHHPRPAHPQAAPLKSAALTRQNSTAATTKGGGETGGSGSLVTLHEAAVTLAVLEDINGTHEDTGPTTPTPETSQDNSQDNTSQDTTTEDSDATSPSPSMSPNTASPETHSTSTPATTNSTSGLHTSTLASSSSTSTRQASGASTRSTTSTPTTPAASQASTSSKVSATSTTTTTTTTTTPTTTTTTTTATSNSTSSTTAPPHSTSTHRPLAHKLVHVASTASGNHVGGFCVWKVDRNITRWSYFYENIPIEYQSHQDTEDHEMRGLLAAVRTWAPSWHDHHVVLRSHHQTIKGSRHPTRRALGAELERLSEGHFTYELEWRFKKTDRIVKISYCLAHLHRDFDHWFHYFQTSVDEELGEQDWAVATKKNRVHLSEEAFLTPPTEEQAGSPTSLH